MTVLEFDGIPFDRTGTGIAAQAAPHDSAAVAGDSASHTTAGNPLRDGDGDSRPPRLMQPLSEIRAGVVTAHRAALAAQVALQRAAWQRAVSSEAHGRSGSGLARKHDSAAAPAGAGVQPSADQVTPAAPEPAFKPLARTRRTALDRDALQRLTDGDLVGVFGTAYHRHGVDSAARLAAGQPLALTGVTAIELRGGTGKGRLAATFDGDPHAAAVQAAELFALFTGMHLCLSGSTLAAAPVRGRAERAAGTLELLVTDIDLIPRPYVTATVAFAGAQADSLVTVSVVEPVGAAVGPGAAAPGTLLNEFHMTHLSRGDQSIAMGPEFAEYTGVRATRLPTGGLLLVDRVLEFDGARGRLDNAAYTSEYDSPADSWYYGDTANDSMPHFVYMETSLQAALLMGYYAGPTLTQPGVTLSLRNLGGAATVLRQVDLRDKTIEQSSRLLSTTILPGSSLQTFDYTLSVDGAPFYIGETMFGYFSDEALANQTGLDAGRTAPTWLDEHADAAVRRIDVAARRADPRASLCARRTLALIDEIDVVDGGGKYDAGYLHSLRAIDGSDWYFERHFHLDPVIPGSLGVESVVHALQEWLLDAGYAEGMRDPVFRIPADIAFSWRYRGQFLPTDGTVELEAHIKEIRRGPRGVTVIADGSLWKPGLRIYELLDLAVELVEREDEQ